VQVVGRAWLPEGEGFEQRRVDVSDLEVVEDPVGDRGGVIVVAVFVPYTPLLPTSVTGFHVHFHLP